MREHPLVARLRSIDPIERAGRVRRLLPTSIEADGPAVGLGMLCSIEAQRSADTRRRHTLAAAVRIDRESVTLAPLEDHASFIGAKVEACAQADSMPVGDALMGRIVDPLGRPLDGAGPLNGTTWRPAAAVEIPPLERCSPHAVLETGIRAIDGLLTLGKGQRVGIFAAAGVGKTSLLNQLARQVVAARVVICLVGERGREVEALWSAGLMDETRSKTTMVAATSDHPAAMRARAGSAALTIADHWRRQGLHVLLLLDSVTRLAMAMREIGLAAGEPPTVRAYTPSVFAALPKLVEGCGAVKAGGSISAIFTVLSETDDVEDPICETMKSLLDGHIILSRGIAERGHFPAIDVPRSVSRQAAGLLNDDERLLAERVSGMISRFEASRTLIEAGLYARGGDRELDEAVARRPEIDTFLRQSSREQTAAQASFSALQVLARGGA